VENREIIGDNLNISIVLQQETSIVKPMSYSPFMLPHTRIIEILEEIAATIEIKSLWQVDRAGEPIIFLNPDAETRLQQIPAEVRERYLSRRLRQLLLESYFHGSDRGEGLDLLDTEIDLENRSGAGVRSSLFQSLDLANRGDGFFDPDWSIIDIEDSGLWAVSKNNLTLHIKPNLHLHQEERSTTVGDRVSVLMPNHLVERGVYIAIGNAGDPLKIQNRDLVVNFYLNIDTEGAIAFLDTITQELNDLNVPFRCQFLYDRDLYECYDTGMLAVAKMDYPVLEKVLHRIYQQYRSHFREGTPLFTKYLARGLAIAELPRGTGDTVEQFALDRFQTIVDGLLSAWRDDRNTPQLRLESMLQSFAAETIDLSHPYLAPNSEDIYQEVFSG
jgi:hypothetical protein